MDDRRFDALTRSLATGLSRRKALKALLGGAVLGGAAATHLDQVSAQTVLCSVGQFLCNDECCDNANNCCGGTTCCPPSQCNQTTGTCCDATEFACGEGDNACCNTQTEKCCDGVCIDASQCCPSLPDCDACSPCVDGVCQPIVCDPCEVCDGGQCMSTCEGNETCCTIVGAAPYCAECCSSDDCSDCWECDTQGACQQTGFLCGESCCAIENNCCGGTTCCPSSQCNQTSGTCCSETQFACGTGDNDCCDTATEKCCDGVCIDRNLCCPSLPDCADGLTCCNGECVDLTSDPTNCGACAADCSSGLLCCQGMCQECCSSDDCKTCERCIDGGACRPLECETPCEYCDDGVDRCVPFCPENQHCCVTGPSTDSTITCVDGSECCVDSDCQGCETCESGACVPKVLPCPLGEITCCNGDELYCAACCDDANCDPCHLCHQGRCVPCEAGGLICCEDACVDQEECCVSFGDECGLLQVSSAGGDWPQQLDCCDGLVCCETHHGSVCAECCSDHECPKGSICCASQCREMECCIDDVLIGLDPNRRCPDGCSCFEGICDCHCTHDHDCAWGDCCCDDGTCSKHCCEHGCHHDKDCAAGTCCCHDGSCSAQCCQTPAPPVSTLPATGSGTNNGGSSLTGAAAIGAAFAAFLAARKLREEQPEDAPADD